MGRNGRRNRERRTGRPVAEGVWVWDKRPEIKARLTARGHLEWVVFDAGRVGSVAREFAAHWLREHFAPGLSHDACYSLLWEG